MTDRASTYTRTDSSKSSISTDPSPNERTKTILQGQTHRKVALVQTLAPMKELRRSYSIPEAPSKICEDLHHHVSNNPQACSKTCASSSRLCNCVQSLSQYAP
jgi:bisphosphoglycerate-dependent phosphoglycerate mutase